MPDAASTPDVAAPAEAPEVIETDARAESDPVAACLDTGRTLVVMETADHADDRLRGVAALARAFNVTLALRPPGDSGPARTAGLAQAFGAALAAPFGVPPQVQRPAPPRARSALTVQEVVLHPVVLPLRDLYVSAMYLTGRQPRAVVEIRTRGGVVGWGETHGAVLPLAAKLAAAWIGRDLEQERAALRRRFARIPFDNRDGRNGTAAFAGLDLAAWDAVARHAGLSLRAALGDMGTSGAVEIACPLPAAAPGYMVTRAELAAHMADLGNAARVADLAHGIAARWGMRAFKYKSAGTGAAWDIAALTALRRALGPGARLRFDPNAAYGTEAARRLCAELEPLALEFYEDPTDGLEGMARLAAHLRTPLATNMCVTAPEHLAAAARRPGVRIVLGDLFLWGGVDGLRDMAAAARLLGLTPAVHSFYETGLATAANAQIALAVGLGAPHAMDCGWPLLAADVVDPAVLRVADGRIACPTGPGLGVAPEPARLAALRTGEPVVVR